MTEGAEIRTRDLTENLSVDYETALSWAIMIYSAESRHLINPSLSDGENPKVTRHRAGRIPEIAT